jgi:non-canonical purine NTP pyrophosphatase (RdgB/HAM1 family)
MEQLVIATKNSGKVREFRDLLLPLQCEVLSLADLAIDAEFEETGITFGENARLKALAYSHLTALPIIADDSGLEVDALGGKPGIYSARYAGEGASDADRIRKLLEELGHCSGSRDARFVCALAFARAGQLLLEAEGECRGVIANEPRGNNGFGYDPVFYFPALGKTYAELTEMEKNTHSHRARAVAALVQQIANRQS